jgi:hypothetical protein
MLPELPLLIMLLELPLLIMLLELPLIMLLELKACRESRKVLGLYDVTFRYPHLLYIKFFYGSRKFIREEVEGGLL